MTLTLSVATISLNGCLNDDDVFDTQAQFNEDIRIIDQYLDENGISARIDDITDIRYVVHDQGTGLQPFMPFVQIDSVTLSYVGTVMETGAEFDRVDNQKRVSTSLISGVLAGISLIQEGGSITAYIPSFYGFGNTEVDGIARNSVLIAEIEFDQLHDRQLRREIQAIDDSLADMAFTATEHPTGIRLRLNQTGGGASPRFNDVIRVNYEGRLFGETSSFDSGQDVGFILNGNLIPGWIVVLREMSVGESVTMYLPASFGFGSRGSAPDIPPNANLEFDVELISVN